ncbi:MAG TPA: peptidylprolyl isomerase [Anaerolineales bacterium]|nr:peptidylprolyl isomerase [Anaerolineales bacterium]
MARSPVKPTLTKKHLARIERERLQRRNILLGSLAVLVLVLGFIGYGLMEAAVLKPRQPVAMVGKDKITTAEFQARVRYERQQLVNQYIQLYDTMQLFGGDPNTQSYFEQNLQQLQFQLEPESMGNSVLSRLIEDRLIRQESARRGITVSREELDKRMEQLFGFYSEGQQPTDTPVPTSAPTSTLSATQLALVPPTATPTATEVFAQTSTAGPTQATGTLEATETPGTPQPSETPTITPTLTPTGPTATPSPTLTPTPYTRESFEKNYQEFLTNLEKDVQVSEAQLRSFVEGQLYREKVMDAISKDLPRTQEQVWARHILVEDEETAKQILARLEAGEDFTALAAELSTDTSNKDNGGDLGWFASGAMVAPFEEAAFALETGEISQPVQSDFGWHIIQALGHENRPLSTSEYEQLKLTEFDKWLEAQRLAAEPEIFDYWRERVPAEPTIPAQLQLG